ncbi:MAG: 50S ribosomal protein L3 N(5)-glutamine methyltransferase, partial [Parvularculaceae bacterium]|nr:50S ribosomal protein L3 N(5)-glutamine methyltransferase [Parvularculaceae bacterium]
VDERVIVPRSFIGEILFGDFVGESDLAIIPDPESVESVLDLCTGSGALAILAATVFPNAEIHATELSPDALEVARRNVEEHGLEDRISLFEGDLFEPLPRGRYDLILANPPYVDAEAMAALPPEYRAEPQMALAGGADGLDLVRRILDAAPDWLADEGGLLCEIGTGREHLEAEYGQLDFFWPETEEGTGEVFWLTAADFGK